MAASSSVKDTTKRLTSGSPMSLILGFSLPLLVGMLFQQFYSLVDTIIVGKFLGVNALAAVGSTGSVNFLINGFCMVCARALPSRWPSGSAPRTRKVCAGMWATASGSPRYSP